MSKMTTSKFRAAFTRDCFTPKSIQPGQEAKFAVTMLFPKNDPWIKEFQKEVARMVKEKWGDKVPKGLKLPLKDGDSDKYEGYEGFAGHYVLAARSKFQPDIIDRKGQKIISEEDFYSGCYAMATIIPYAFDQPMAKGIGLALGNLLKYSEGEKFKGSKVDATEDFKSLIDPFSAEESTTSSNGDDIDLNNFM